MPASRGDIEWSRERCDARSNDVCVEGSRCSEIGPEGAGRSRPYVRITQALAVPYRARITAWGIARMCRLMSPRSGATEVHLEPCRPHRSPVWPAVEGHEISLNRCVAGRIPSQVSAIKRSHCLCMQCG